MERVVFLPELSVTIEKGRLTVKTSEQVSSSTVFTQFGPLPKNTRHEGTGRGVRKGQVSESQ